MTTYDCGHPATPLNTRRGTCRKCADRKRGLDKRAKARAVRVARAARKRLTAVELGKVF